MKKQCVDKMRACKEIEDTKRDQKEVLKLKSTVTKVKKKNTRGVESRLTAKHIVMK